MVTEIVYEIEDDDGDRATTSVKVASTHSLTLVSGFGRAFADLIDNIVGGAIVAAKSVFEVNIGGLTIDTPVVEADVEEIGKLLFLTSGGTRVELNIPTMPETSVATGSDELDQANPALAAIIDAMNVGIAVTGGTIQPCDVGEQSIVSIIYAREGARASGKAR